MAKFCTECGAKLEPNVKFCTECGCRVPQAPEPAPRAASRPDVSRPAPPKRTTPRPTAVPSPQRTPPPAAPAQQKTPRKGGSRFLSMLLVIVMFVELGIAGFKRPGWFVEKDEPTFPSVHGTGGTNGTSGTAGSSGSHTSLPAAEISADTAPGHPSLISWIPDAAEISRLPAEEADLSTEQQAVSFASGSVNVDFMGCLEGEDSLQFREVGTRSDNSTGRDMVVYDFELASGIHEPGGYVKITVPRPSGDGSLDVVSYNSSTGQWESLYFEVGDQTITYYKNHFSPDGVRIDRNSLFTGDPCFYLLDTQRAASGREYTPLQAPIILNKSAVAKYIAATSPALIAALKNGSNLDVDVQFYGTFMNVVDAAGHIDAASTAFEFMTKSKLDLPILNQISAIGGKLGLMKLLWQITQNKDTVEALKENWADIASTVASAVGGSNPFALALQLALYAYGQQDKPWVQRQGIHSYEFTAWDDYMKEHGVVVKVRGKTFTLYSDGSGWKSAVNTLVEVCKQDCANGEYDTFPTAMGELYRKFFDNFWDLSNLQKQEYGEKNYYRLGMSYDGVGNAFDSFRWQSWQDPDAETLESWKSLIRSEVNQQIGGILRDAIQNMYIAGCEAIIRDVESNILPELNKIVILEVHDPSLPEGTPFSESAYAQGALEYTDWAYNTVKAIRFDNISTKPRFWPANASEFTYGDFNWSYFYPRVQEDSSRIFTCRVYNLMQIGIPLDREITMHFEGTGDPLHPPIDVPFTIAPNGVVKQMHVVTLELTPPEADFAGFYDFYETDFDIGAVDMDQTLYSGDTDRYLAYAGTKALQDMRVYVDPDGTFSGAGSGSFSHSVSSSKLQALVGADDGSGSMSMTFTLDELAFDGIIVPATLQAAIANVGGSGTGSGLLTASDDTGSLSSKITMTIGLDGTGEANLSVGKLPGGEDCCILKITLHLKGSVYTVGTTTEKVDGKENTATQEAASSPYVILNATYVKPLSH